MRFVLNDKLVETNVPSGTRALDYIRGHAGLKGTKAACREGDCGACMVLLGELAGKKVDYKAVTSCLLALGEVEGKHLVTVEGLNQKGLNPIQQAIVDNGATQCGFCTPGFVVALTGFFLTNKNAEENNILKAIEGNICRCTGYASIKRAAKALYQGHRKRKRFVPQYFAEIPSMLRQIERKAATKSRSRALIIGGGTDLLLQDNLPREFRFLSDDKDLQGIHEDGDSILIGAGTATEFLMNLPPIGMHIHTIASQPIRGVATVGGNIVNASPVGDLTIMLLALNVTLQTNKRKAIPLRSFYKGYKRLDLRQGELVEKIRIEKWNMGYLFNFEKISKRRHLDIASVNSAISIDVKEGVIADAHLSAGGVSPIPMYLNETNEFLRGATITANAVRNAARIADSEIAPISDVRGSENYKRLLLRQLLYAHFIELFPEMHLEEELL